MIPSFAPSTFQQSEQNGNTPEQQFLTQFFIPQQFLNPSHCLGANSKKDNTKSSSEKYFTNHSNSFFSSKDNDAGVRDL